jgi:hypothetical protein
VKLKREGVTESREEITESEIESKIESKIIIETLVDENDHDETTNK